jgi:hypothetical protein
MDDRNDIIDNAVFEVLKAMSHEEIEWDMEVIGEIADFAGCMLTEHGIKICRPWYNIDDNTPCYKTTDRCYYCTH